MMKGSVQLDKLIALLGYTFNNIKLLDEALTHRSAAAKNNERLEFLGDSILNFVIAAELFDIYPKCPEGDLSRLRSSLVKKEGLALVAQDLVLGDYLILGAGELKSGGFRRDSILADTVEAIMGAVYLDGGFDACRRMILKLYEKQLQCIPDPATLKDAKTRLQELLQARKFSLPNYQVVAVSGKAHQQIFSISCEVAELSISTNAQAASRRKAEQLAAEQAIDQLEVALASIKAAK